MALFGSLLGKKPKMFGQPEPEPSGYGVGMGMMPVAQTEAQPAQKPKGIFNGGSFTGRDAIGLALGAIGDGLAQNNGGQAVIAPMLMSQIRQRQEDERGEKMYQRKREDTLTDWKTQQDYKRNYPDLTNFQENLRAGGIDPRSPEGIAAAKNYVERLGDPMVTTSLPGDRFYSGPQSGLSTALGGGQAAPSAAPPAAAIDMLRGNPGLSSDFDAKYGAGSAARILGHGGPGPGQGGFRKPY